MVHRPGRTAARVHDTRRAQLVAGSPVQRFSQLEWLRHHHVAGDSVENLFLWLEANNALGTVVRMKLRKTADQANETS
jgi:hypothetical protein